MNQAAGQPRFAIITGDDFGSSSAVNQGILQAHERGILTSASLMVTGDAFEEAVALGHAHPRLAVGLHLTVSSGRAALPPQQVPHLVDSAGRFSSHLVKAGLWYQFSPQARRELALEIRAQLEKFRRTGLRLSHLDGHQHMHMHPVVLEALIDLSEEFGIRAIRLPGEELAIAVRIDRSRLLIKCVYSWTFGWLRRWAAARLRSARIEFADRVYGLLQTGRMTEEYLLRLIPKIQGNRVEIYSHPTLAAEIYSSRGASRAQLDALLSPGVREALVLSGFQLTTYTIH
ncbi:MAG: hopanoid biosynthesis-associated protein HpnK [Candidatus Omnitrophica bacterium]|nr:hopanoid biosynthesis-associated protein HpnK [Candidatus Omnitrophota bacterium]